MYKITVGIFPLNHQEPNAARRIDTRSRFKFKSVNDRVLLILDNYLTIMLFESSLLSHFFFRLRYLYSGISSINNIRNRWRLGLRLTHRLCGRIVSILFWGLLFRILWVAGIEFGNFSLNYIFCFGNLRLDAICIWF
jgi:hypothetical protein